MPACKSKNFSINFRPQIQGVDLYAGQNKPPYSIAASLSVLSGRPQRRRISPTYRISVESKSSTDQSSRCRIFSVPTPSHLTSSFTTQSMNLVFIY